MLDKEFKQIEIQRLENEVEKQWRLNAFFSRKLVLAFVIVLVSFIAVMLKINQPEFFVTLFKEWCWLMIAIFGIYTGGNVGTKFTQNLQKK